MAIRKSNFELLRLVTMLLIVLLHVNYYSLGVIDETSFITGLPTYTRLFFELFCIIGVNVFVLISGWFSIKPSFAKLASLLFQVTFYSVSITLIFNLMGWAPFDKGYLFQSVYLGALYWFVVSYIILYALSPILNAFAENTDRITFRNFLIYFFLVEFVYGWLFEFEHFDKGYSALSFIGLYLLARYLRKYTPQVLYLDIKVLIPLYFASVLVPATVDYIHLWGGVFV